MDLVDVGRKRVDVLKKVMTRRIIRLEFLVHGDSDKSSLVPVNNMPSTRASRIDGAAGDKESTIRFNHVRQEAGGMVGTKEGGKG